MKVLANSLPKSGTHVLTRILDLIGFEANSLHFSGAITRNRSNNPIKIIKNRIETTLNVSEGFCLDLDEDRFLRNKYFAKLINSFADETYSQAHIPYSIELENEFEKNDIKILYIIRDPRDVLISHFHHHHRDENYDGHKLMNLQTNDKDKILLSLNGFNLNTYNPTLPLKERIERTKGWYFTKSKNVCSVKFEDIIGVKGLSSEEKQIETIKKIEDFLEINDSSLLKQKDKIYYEKAETFRKAKINDWKNYFDEEIKVLVKNSMGDYLIELGYENDLNW
ncbi:MAG: hypothetical protein COA59_07240 [Colwellia sp.]|jgi:hypothetical protein|nr:MAG: hypothetical protein COA59_07240 [Colwellia sp.]